MMSRRKSGSPFSGTVTIMLVVVLTAVVAYALGLFDVLVIATTPFESSTAEVSDALKELVVPLWTDFAIAAPGLFAIALVIWGLLIDESVSVR